MDSSSCASGDFAEAVSPEPIMDSHCASDNGGQLAGSTTGARA